MVLISTNFCLLLIVTFLVLPLSSASCKSDADCTDGSLCSDSNCLKACGGIGGVQIGCQEGFQCIDDPTDNCDPKFGRNCQGSCKRIIDGEPGDSCGLPPDDCPALRCACGLCDNGVDVFGCCGKCVVVMNENGMKECSGAIPKEFCPDVDRCRNAKGFIGERVCQGLYQYGCDRDCTIDFCKTLMGLIRRPTAPQNRAWLPGSCQY